MQSLAAQYNSDDSDEESAPRLPSSPRRSAEPGPASSLPACGFFGLSEEIEPEPAAGSFWSATDRFLLSAIEKSAPAVRVRESVHREAAGPKRKRTSADLSWSDECERAMTRESTQYKTKRAASAGVAAAGGAVSGGSSAPEPPEARPKLLYVHHEVAPFITNKHAGHRIPKNISSSFVAHAGAVNKIKWCKRLEYSHLAATASMDAKVKLWNLLSKNVGGSCVSTIECHCKAVKDVNWTASGAALLTSGYDRSAVLTDVQTGSAVHRRQLTDFVLCNAFQPISDDLAILGGDNKLYLIDFRMSSALPPAMQYTHKDKFGQVQDVVFDRHGEVFFSSGSTVSRESADMSVMAWDKRTGAVLSNQMYQEHYVCVRLKLHPREPILLAQTNGNYVALFAERPPFKMNKQKRYESHTVDGYSIGFDISSDGKFIISGSCDGNIYVYDAQSSKCLATLENNRKGDPCLDLAVHPALPSTLATCFWGGGIRMWS